MFGFCSYGASKDLDKHNCPGIYQKHYSGKVKQGRKSVDGLVWLDEYAQCTCLCHVPVEDRPKPKARKARTKKPVKKPRKK